MEAKPIMFWHSAILCNRQRVPYLYYRQYYVLFVVGWTYFLRNTIPKLRGGVAQPVREREHLNTSMRFISEERGPTVV